LETYLILGPPGRKGITYAEFKTEWLHEKRSVETGNLGTVSVFASRQRMKYEDREKEDKIGGT
jgi:hypothetical protein